jgi:hypothetical protein
VLHETRQHPAGGIVDHADQIQLRATPFQPIVLAGVPLHQFAKAAAAWTPRMYLIYALGLRSPPLGCDHPAPDGFAAHLHIVLLG